MPTDKDFCEQVQEFHDSVYDVVERPDGGFRIVGEAADSLLAMDSRAFVFDIDASGMLQSRYLYGDSDKRSMLMGLDRAGDDYVAAGTQFNGVSPDAFGDVMVLKLGPSLTGIPAASTLLTDTAQQDKQNTGFNVVIAGDGTAHVGSVLNCVGHGYCRRHFAGGTGDLTVHRVDPVTLSELTATNIVQVRASDILVGMTRTSDGGVALVSTVQPVPHPTPHTHTDAFVAKLNSAAAVQWTKTYDARTNLEDAASINRHKQCLFDITETADGDLLVVGTNSSNFDDYYAVRFTTESSVTLPATTLEHAHLVYPTATNLSTTLTGSLVAEASGRVWVDPGRTLQFEAPWGVTVKGEMEVDGATLTAAGPSGWAGIQVVGTTASAAFSDAVIEDVDYPLIEPTAALRVFNGSATLSNTEVRNNVGHGLYVSGATASLKVLNGSEVHSNAGVGIMAVQEAAADVRNSTLEDNLGSGVLATSGATVYLFENTITDNQGYGAHAIDYGEVVFERPQGLVPHPPGGFNELSFSDGGGLFADDLGSIVAGVPDEQDPAECLIGCLNDITDHSWGTAPFDARASGQSVVWADLDYWGDDVHDIRDLVLIEEPGSMIFIETILDEPVTGSRPAVAGPVVAAVEYSGGLSGRSAEAGRAVLLAARAAAARENYVAALALLKAYAQASPESSYAVLAYTEMARLLRVEQPDAALSFLSGAASGTTAHRPWALQALVMAHSARGSAGDAEAAAGALALDYPSSRHALFGHLASFRLRLEAGDFSGAENALVAAQSGWPEHPSVASAAALIEALTGAGTTQGRGAGGEGIAATQVSASPSPLELAVWPNPTGATATASFALEEPGRFRLAVYDVLGRLVIVAFEGDAGAGAVEVPLDLSRLSSGVYLLRLEVAGEQSIRHVVRRLTIAR